MEKKHIYFIAIAIVLCLSPVWVMADIKLPSIFGDNMVLQQQANAAIWGEATPNKTVTVVTSWNKKSYSTKANKNGQWELAIQTPVAGGPYSLTISDGKKITLNDILIGEVWICSGQSNMQMPMKGYWNEPVDGSNKAIATSTNKAIRLFTVDMVKSLEPQADFRGEWTPCTPENVAEFSAVGYFFAEMIQQTLDVPIGIICSSWGGTRIEPWISENELKRFDWVSLPDKKEKGELSPQTPTVLFNAMIAPMVGYTIQGALWYQGESNKDEPKQYEELMNGLIQDWRKAWGIGDFSFFFVQIAPFIYPGQGLNSAFLREAQLKASTATPNTGLASTMDIGESNSVHPANKKLVGERLAFLALSKTYDQKGFGYSGPVFNEMIVDGQVAKLTFDHTGNGLTSFGKKLVNFKIAGENKHFVPAEAFIKGSEVILFSPKVEKPVAVRYAFEDFVVGELYNTQGLPASSFRTDDWEIK
ncbi:sialate O-acetylesterase [Maribellus sp. CM-23]|uniref:sialate O-acetylesterase n=1 Tax=Maribellus sp. CM-23 TaxID=2781026 RepID=UPI001F408A65|nr:sialate O-acetylesterase [Maribellus sp. CM-23]MCE4566717.1 sialate O-acetylesterase [Maribellus sp. CM-23]